MRLIDADKLKQQDFQDFSNTDVMNAIDNCPTEDTTKYAHWQESDDGFTPICSHCKRTHKCFMINPDYCPNCGYKMTR